jgi:flagellar motor switch protein FliM
MPATLSPEEVKALMSAVQDGRVPSEGARGARGPVASYDLTSQDRIIRGQMPTLDAINDQVASAFSTGLTGRTRTNLKVVSAAATLLKFADLTPLLAPPASVCVLGLGPGYGFGLIVLELGLGEALLAAALGDRRSRAAEAVPEGRRDFTAIEQTVLRRLLGIFTDAVGEAWRAIIPFAPEVLRFEVDPRMAAIAPPSDVGIVSAFEIAGALEGRLQLVIPFATVEPAKQRLASPRRLSPRADERMRVLIARELESVRVGVRGLLGRTRINLSRLLELEPGDLLLLDTAEGDPLPMVVQGREKLRGTPSVSGGAMAMTVVQPLATLQAPLAGAALTR